MHKTLEQTGQLAPLDQPWQLIRDALDDLKLNENCPDVCISMNNWHTPAEGVCLVCLAGSTVARRCGTFLDQKVVPSTLRGDDARAMRALDYFRTGFDDDGLRELGLRKPWSIEYTRLVRSFHTDREAFYLDLYKLADDLEEAFTGKVTSHEQR
jgi:hypothetical protein